jgi:hypothetical protein
MIPAIDNNLHLAFIARGRWMTPMRKTALLPLFFFFSTRPELSIELTTSYIIVLLQVFRRGTWANANLAEPLLVEANTINAQVLLLRLGSLVILILSLPRHHRHTHHPRWTLTFENSDSRVVERPVHLA